MANITRAEVTFVKEVLQLRHEYEQRRTATNLTDRPFLESEFQRGERSYITYWYDDGTCVRIFDVPGTLSGDILRLYSNLPPLLSGYFEIDGDNIRRLNSCLEYDEPEDDCEDVSELVSKLPLVSIDPIKHFVKKGKYISEIENLVKCQGGSIPGNSAPNIIQLLGRSADGELVFEKLSPSAYILGRFSSLAVYKSWILQLINALDYLHSLGIVHRDLRADNLLFSNDGKRIVVCDLESHWGERSAPEVSFKGGLEEAGWTPRSDIYEIGNCIKSMVYANTPITPFVKWPVPAPLQVIVEACMRLRPEERPTLAELRIMVEEIEA